MDDEIKTVYRGVEIGFSEHTETWIAHNADLKDASLKTLKGKIDAALKSEFKPVPVLYKRWSSDSDLEEGVLTGVDKNDGAWVKAENGRREKVYGDIILVSDTNKARFKKIDELKATAEAAKKAVADEYNKLQFFKRGRKNG